MIDKIEVRDEVECTVNTYLGYGFHADRVFPDVYKWRQNNNQVYIGYNVGTPGKSVSRKYWVDTMDRARELETLLREEAPHSHVYCQWFGEPDVWEPHRFHTQRIKFCPEHFPPGTQFRCEDLSYIDKDEVFTTEKVVRNGVNSFVIVTTTPHPEGNFMAGVMKSYNIDHVTQILSRGEGNVVYESYSIPTVGHRKPFCDNQVLRIIYQDYARHIPQLREDIRTDTILA